MYPARRAWSGEVKVHADLVRTPKSRDTVSVKAHGFNRTKTDKNHRHKSTILNLWFLANLL